MKKFWKYALVAMLAVAMLFSFASCDDDDDDDDDDDVSLSDAEIVNIVAAAFVDAITTGYGTDDDGNITSDYSSWTQDSSYTLTISTTSEYTGYVDSSYTVTEDSTDAYTVTVSSGSSVIVYLGYLNQGYNGPVYVTINATVDGADENLALTAYLDSSMSVLGSNDSTDETDYTPSLTINGVDSDLTEDDIKNLVLNLIKNVVTVMSSSGSSAS